jgi:hypothetical protein
VQLTPGKGVNQHLPRFFNIEVPRSQEAQYVWVFGDLGRTKERIVKSANGNLNKASKDNAKPKHVLINCRSHRKALKRHWKSADTKWNLVLLWR